MTDGTYRGRWMDEVCGTPLVSAEVKVLLLTMARWMDTAGHVSVPREDLAALLRCHPRKVTEKQASAIEAGLLLRTAMGRRGKPASFQALIPGSYQPERVPTVGTQTEGDRGPTVGTQTIDWVPTTSTLSQPERVPTVGTLSGGLGADSRHPNEAPLYKARAYARSKADLPPQPENNINHQSENTGHTPGGQVVPIFGELNPAPKTHTPPAHAGEEDPAFAAFWKTYPRRVGIGAARKAWAKAIKAGADPEHIILGARRYATDPRRAAADIRYTAHPATWLNAERWADEDEDEPAARAAGDHQPWTNPTDHSVYDEDL